MERSNDFKIIKHILTKHGFSEIGKDDSSITYFQNDSGVRTSFIDREENFSKKYLTELADQLNLESNTFMNTYNVIKEMLKK